MFGSDLANWVTVLGVVVQAFALLGLLQQARSGRKTLESQHFLTLVQYLQSSDVRDAKEHVIAELRDKNFENWCDKDKLKASRFCGAYNTLGEFLRRGLIPIELIEYYEPSITEAYRICEPFIAERRDRVKNDWSGLEYLRSELTRRKLGSQ